MRQEGQGTSPWVWILGGCGGCLVLAVAAVIGLGMAGYEWTRGFVESLENPEAREAKVLEILGAEELPEGYYAAMPMSIPWVMEVVILSERQLEFHRENPDSLDIDLEDDDFGDRVFMYIGARNFSSSEKDVEDFFAGRQVQSMQINTGGSRVRNPELLREGKLEVRGTPVRYRIDRGALDAGDGDRVGLIIRLHFQCEDSGWMRLGLWSGPAADQPGDRLPAEATGTMPDAAPTAEVEGTGGDSPGLPADETSIRSFLEHFDVCA